MILALAKVIALKTPIVEGLMEETYIYNQICAVTIAKERMRMFLQESRQTREKELDILNLIDKFLRKIEGKSKKWLKYNLKIIFKSQLFF